MSDSPQTMAEAAVLLNNIQRDVATLQRILLKSAEPGLYVRRRLLPVTADALQRWAWAQGFHNVLPSEDLHATVIYSRRTIPWQSLPSHVVVPAISSAVELKQKRSVQALGDEGAVVLRFESPSLHQRWTQALREGATWDHEGGYKPHVTITYDGSAVDLSTVRPFADTIEFGPEVQGPIDHDWLDKVRAQQS